MNVLKSLVLVAVACTSVSALAGIPLYSIEAGNNSYTDIPVCGPRARAKAVYSNTTGVFSLRVCDNDYCKYPLKINVNAKYQEKQETSVFSSPSSQGVVHLNGQCYEFPLDYRLQPNQKNLRAIFGEDTWFENAAKIDIKLQ